MHPTAAAPLALAVSGGPDSMAMLALARAAFPGAIVAATVDHHLRPDSGDEAATVAGYCHAAGIPHATLTVARDRGPGQNLHDWARQQRYLALKRWAIGQGAGALCTAHHAEDQAETFLMRAARGSGLSGLAAVRARIDEDVPTGSHDRMPSNDGFIVHRAALALIRPLLAWRRAELRAVAIQAQLPIVDDPSNRDTRFDRSRFRSWLEAAAWIDPAKVGRAAAYLAEAEADMLAISQWLWRERALPADDFEARFDVADVPRGVRRHLARMGIEHVRQMQGLGHPPPGNLEALLDALEAGASATQAGVLASADGTRWHFREAPPRRAR